MVWDQKAHEDVLMAVNNAVDPTTAEWKCILGALHDMGYSFTMSALK
jgi:hypothetical protein